MSEELLTKQFKGLGIQDAKIKEILKNKKLANALSEITDQAKQSASFDSKQVNSALLHSLAVLSKDASPESKNNRKLITDAIVDTRIKTTVQLDGELIEYEDLIRRDVD